MRDRPNDQHRTALAKKLGRPLRPGEIAHHRNTDKADNSPANLEPQTRADHSAHHTDPAVKHTAKLTHALTMPRRGEKLYP